jgi:hypothetical protein
MGKMRLRKITLAIILSLAIAPTGCLSPKKRVAARFTELRSQWTTNLVHQAKLPEQIADWPSAVSLLHAQNLKLRSGRFDITNSQESVRQVFKDLMPTINLRAGVTRSLKSLSAIAFDDVTFSVDSFFNVPGIVNMNARFFSARLTLLRAQLAYQLAEREQMIELYKLFLGYQESRELSAQLQAEQRLAESIQKTDALAGQDLLEELKGRRLALEKQIDTLQATAGDLFADHGRRWNLQTNGWPVLPYAQQPLPLADTNRVAQLQIKLVAVELVGAWAQLKGIKLQYWPELTMYITGPPVYQRAAGAQQVWSPADVRASVNVFWQLDTRGEIARQLRQVGRDQTLQKERVRQESLALIDKLLIAQKLMVTLREQLDQLRRFLPLLEGAPAPQDYAGLWKTVETNRSLRDQERKLRRDLAELNILFWFVDEQQWKSL